MKSNLFHKLSSAVYYRINSLESEVDILDQEIPLISNTPGTTKSDQTKLILLRNIKSVLHDILLLYYTYFCSICPHSSDSIPEIVKIHIQILQKQDVLILIHELFGQQSAINTFVGKDYDKYSHDYDVPDDMQLRLLTQVFPFEFEYDLLSNPKFFSFLLKIVNEYFVQNHENCIKQLFERISEEKPKTIVYFFTGDSPLYFALSEHFLSTFVHDTMLRCEWDELENFAVFEKCRLIGVKGPESCCVNQRLINLLKESTPLFEKSDFSEILRAFNTKRISDINILTQQNDICQIPQIKHIVLDLKRLSLQTSPSFVLCVLANSLYWLTNAITTDGNVVGADEIFQFFVYSLALSEPKYLPALNFFTERFLDSGLNETKFSYLLTQLRCALEFIQQKLLQVPPFLIFPFQNNIPRLQGDEMKKVNSIALTGFRVFAFPTFRREREELFPAMLQYTGNKEDIAYCASFSFKSSVNMLPKTAPNFEVVPTLNGSFLQLTDEMINNCQMIHLDTGVALEEAADDIEILSILMKLNPLKKNYKLSKTIKLFDNIKKKWKLNGNFWDDGKLCEIVRKVQNAISENDNLPPDLTVNGKLDAPTTETIIARFRLDINDEFTPDMFDSIIKQPKNKTIP